MTREQATRLREAIATWRESRAIREMMLDDRGLSHAEFVAIEELAFAHMRAVAKDVLAPEAAPRGGGYKCALCSENHYDDETAPKPSGRPYECAMVLPYCHFCESRHVYGAICGPKPEAKQTPFDGDSEAFKSWRKDNRDFNNAQCGNVAIIDDDGEP